MADQIGDLLIRYITALSGAAGWGILTAGLAMLPVALIWMWVNLAVIVRRLHDIDQSAWFLFLLIPLFGLIPLSYMYYTAFLNLFIDAIPIIVSLCVGLKHGSPLPNRYGSP